MPDFRELTDLQLTILGVLWERGECTIAALDDALSAKTGASRKTIATLLSRLQQRGIVQQRLVGREGIFRAAVSRRAVVVARMGSVLGALFETDAAAAGVRAVGAQEVRRGDVARIRAMLRKAERDLRDDG